jgi:hypothetical protein
MPAETKPERTLPRIRDVNEIYHPWDPFKEMHQERKKRIAEMRRKGRKKAKRPKKEVGAFPAQATLDSAVGVDAGQSIDQGEVSDSQMVDHILQQLESTSRSAAQSSPLEDQTNLPESVERTPAEDQFSPSETSTSTAHPTETYPVESSSPELQYALLAPNPVTTGEEESGRLEIENNSVDPSESTPIEEQSVLPEIPSQASNSIEITAQDETRQPTPPEEPSGIQEIMTTTPKVEAPPRKRGRPKGSKNRPKD